MIAHHPSKSLMFPLGKRTPRPELASSGAGGNRIKSSRGRRRWREKKKTVLSLKASHEEGDGATLCWTLGGRDRGLKWSLLARALAWRHRRSDPETWRSLQQKIRPPAQRRTHLTASNFENRLSLCLLHGIPIGQRSLPWIRSDTQSRRLRAPLKRLHLVQIAGEPQNHLHRTENVLLSAIC